MLVANWSRVKSSEPNAGDVTRKTGPLYFTKTSINGLCLTGKLGMLVGAYDQDMLLQQLIYAMIKLE